MESVGSTINIELLVLLVAIAALVAIGAKQFKVPYTIALVLAGLLLSTLNVLPPVHLTEGLLLLIFLPALLFDAAWNLNFRILSQNWLPITLLAVIGLVMSTGVIAIILSYGLGLPILVSMMFGALMSATDPVSVLALFKQMHVDQRFTTIVEGESLFNDGTAVVIFKLLFSIVALGLASPALRLDTLIIGGIIQFLIVVVGGILIGSVIGIFFSYLTRLVNDHLLELTFTTIVAYGSFILADQIEVPGIAPGVKLSGVIATVAAGLVMGEMGRQKGMSMTTKTVISSFWEYAAFFVNSLVFLLIGLEIHIQFLLAQWESIVIAIVAVLIGRCIAVYGVVPFFNLKSSAQLRIPTPWQHMLVWGGLRGALSMALVLSLPVTMPQRSLLIGMVFGVVLFSLLGQGLSLSWLLKKLKIITEVLPELDLYQRLKTKLFISRQTLGQLEVQKKTGQIAPWVARSIERDLKEEVQDLEKEMEALNLSSTLIKTEEKMDAQVRMLSIRRGVLTDLIHHGAVPGNIAEDLLMEIDESFEKLHHTPPPSEDQGLLSEPSSSS